MRSKKLASSKVQCTCEHPKERHFTIAFDTACRKWDCLCPKFTPANGQEIESDPLSELDPVLASPEAKRRARIASSKSKSQTHCACGHLRRWHHNYGCHASGCRCILWYRKHLPLNEPIAEAVPSQSEPLSGSNPCQPTSDAAEVVITKNSGFWCTMFGSHKSPILNEDKKPIPDRDDPIMVAKYLASHARGPINVIWW